VIRLRSDKSDMRKSLQAEVKRAVNIEKRAEFLAIKTAQQKQALEEAKKLLFSATTQQKRDDRQKRESERSQQQWTDQFEVRLAANY
jgi:hypothetical protein